MNYLKAYVKLIRLRQNKPTSPNHRHHIFPKSIYGENDFVVCLSPREHFIAHKLLVKIFNKRYGKSDHRTVKMARAVMYMTSNPHIRTSKDYSFYSNILRENMKTNNPMYDSEIKRRSVESNKKITKKIKESTRQKWSCNRTEMNILNNPMKNPCSRKKSSMTQKHKHSMKTHEELEAQRISNSKAGKCWWNKMLENNTEEELKEYRLNLIEHVKEKNSKTFILIKTSGENVVIKNMAEFARSMGYKPHTFRNRLLAGKEIGGYVGFKKIDE